MIISLETGIGDLTSYTGKTWTKLQNRFDFDGSYQRHGFILFFDRQQSGHVPAGGRFIRSHRLTGWTWSSVRPISTTRLTPKECNLRHIDELEWPWPHPAGPACFQGLTPASLTVGIQDKKAWAVYADATYEVVDKLFFNIGGRYSSEKQDLLVSIECILPAAQCTTATVIDGRRFTFVPTTGNFKYNQFTPRAGLRYELGPLQYLRHIFEGLPSRRDPSSLAGLTPATWLPIKSETVDAFEIGYKSGGQFLRFELAAFMYDFTNLQIPPRRSCSALRQRPPWFSATRPRRRSRASKAASNTTRSTTSPCAAALPISTGAMASSRTRAAPA